MEFPLWLRWTFGPGCSPPIDTKYGKPRAFRLATVDHEVFGLIKIDVSSILFRDQCHCVGIFFIKGINSYEGEKAEMELDHVVLSC